jgi:gamma-glutamylcyclotransferase (GGCT)/AIG2-like uncharacterized protein YtfP
MKGRVPSVSFYGRAKLENHRLDFTRKSINRNCGVADIVENNNYDVWGAIFRFDEHDLGNLDRCEEKTWGSGFTSSHFPLNPAY